MPRLLQWVGSQANALVKLEEVILGEVLVRIRLRPEILLGTECETRALCFPEPFHRKATARGAQPSDLAQ